MKQPDNNISEVKLIYRTRVKASDRPQIKCSRDAYELFLATWDQDAIEHVEHFNLMLLNRSNRVLGIAEISKGGLSGTVTDVRVILQYVIKSNASGIIVCHYAKKILMQSDIVNTFFPKYIQENTLHNNFPELR